MTEKLSEHSQSSDRQARYKVAGESTTSSIDNKKRKEIRLTLPEYTQTFDVTTLLDVPHMRSAVLSQPYRIYSSDNKILAEGVMSEISGTVRTKSSLPVPVRLAMEDGKSSMTVMIMMTFKSYLKMRLHRAEPRIFSINEIDFLHRLLPPRLCPAL